MRWTQTLIPTLKETPADATVASHQLMLRAGMIRQLAAGVYDFLPLGLRALHKAAAIVREEMDRLGAAEVLLPALNPIELWQRSGRDAQYGKLLLRLKDQHGRGYVLAPTHEETMAELVAAHVSSYKQLPLILYQIQTKFRDEERPRFGLLRVREFLMKDAYSFHADAGSLDETYDRIYAAYAKIFARCGVPFVAVEAESGPIGGSASHEFVTLADAGEDVIVLSDRGNYAANVERAAIGPRPWTFDAEPTGDLQEVHTPNLPGVDEVAAFMKVKPRNMLKSMLYVLTRADDDPDPLKARQQWYLLAIVRGDHQVNEAKLAKAAAQFVSGGAAVRVTMAPEALARRDGFALGFVGPHAIRGRDDAFMLVDPDAAQGGFWAAGANAADRHVKHFNWSRELGDALGDAALDGVALDDAMPNDAVSKDALSKDAVSHDAPPNHARARSGVAGRVRVADIRDAAAGDPSPRDDGGVLRTARGVEIGHVFKLGTRYSETFDATFLDDQGRPRPIVMGSYGIGIGRILIAAVEALHDDRGIVWPAALAPYRVIVTPIGYAGDVRHVADTLYHQLTAAGVDALLDDRPDVRPGARFADADLIGIPLRINIGDRGLKDGGVVELKRRGEADVTRVAVGDVVDHVRRALGAR